MSAQLHEQRRIFDLAMIRTGAPYFLTVVAFSEAVMGQLIVAAVAGFVAIVAALINRRPSMLKARQEDEKMHSTEAAGVIDNLAKIHQEELAYYRRRIDSWTLDLRVANRAKELVRKSKHNALNEISAAYLHIHYLEGILTREQMQFKTFDFKDHSQICKEEDAEMTGLYKVTSGEMKME